MVFRIVILFLGILFVGACGPTEEDNVETTQTTQLLPPGIRNCGNSCYLNASLQMLLASNSFRGAVEDFLNRGFKNKQNQELDAGDNLIAAKTIYFLIKRLTPNITANDLLAPAYEILDAVIKAGGTQLEHGRQEDAPEFLEKMLNVFELVFPVYLNTTLYKNGESREIVRIENNPIFKVTIKDNASSKQSTALIRLLEKSINAKKNDPNNKMKWSDEPNDFADYHEEITYLNAAPNDLFIQLGRFDYKTKNGNYRQYKLDNRIRLPRNEIIDLKSIINPEIREEDAEYRYRVKSIINHHGSTTSSGHYTNFSRYPNGKWYLFDDSRVEEVTYADVRRGSMRDGYVILLEKVKP